jgi:hypothetical protein
MITKTINYFERENIDNLLDTLKLSDQRAESLGIKQILIFTSEGSGVEEAIKMGLHNKYEIIPVTFPAFEKKIIKDGDKDCLVNIRIPEQRRKLFNEKGIVPLSGTMPFRGLLTPYNDDVKLRAINMTFNTISLSLNLVVQSVLMACDGGRVEEGTDVIALTHSTSIVARACPSMLFFHPIDGFKILEIICKPREATLPKIN